MTQGMNRSTLIAIAMAGVFAELFERAPRPASVAPAPVDPPPLYPLGPTAEDLRAIAAAAERRAQRNAKRARQQAAVAKHKTANA